MKLFTTGAQNFFHSSQLMWQILSKLIKIAVITMILTILIFSANKISYQNFVTFIKYYQALYFTKTGSNNKKIAITNQYNQQKEIIAQKYLQDKQLINIKNQTLIKFQESFIISILFSFVILTIVTFIFLIRGKKIQKVEHLRGAQEVEAQALKKLIIANNRKQKYQAYKLAQIEYPAYSESLHSLICGGSGTGKTTVINNLIKQIKDSGDRAIIYDRMGSFVSRFYDDAQDIILSPLDARSRAWNIYQEVDNASGFRNIAAALIPHSAKTSDPFWTDAARIIFTEICTMLQQKNKMSNKALVDALLLSNLDEIASLLQTSSAANLVDTRSPKTALSIMSVLTTYLQSLKYLKDDKEYFSIKKWIEGENKSGFLFVNSRANRHEILRPLISAWLEIATNTLLGLEQSQNRKIWIILDELPSLNYLPSLQSGLAESRQFGGAFVISMQLMAQMREIYGKDGAEAISGLCRNRLIFSTPDKDTANWCAETIGRMEIDEFRQGQSYGVSHNRDGVNVHRNKNLSNIVLPSQIMNMPNLTAYIKMAGNYPVANIKIKYEEFKLLNKGFIAQQDLEQSQKNLLEKF